MAYSSTGRTENYRLIATGLHVLARTAKHDETRSELLDLANRYERLAATIECRKQEMGAIVFASESLAAQGSARQARALEE